MNYTMIRTGSDVFSVPAPGNWPAPQPTFAERHFHYGTQRAGVPCFFVRFAFTVQPGLCDCRENTALHKNGELKIPGNSDPGERQPHSP